MAHRRAAGGAAPYARSLRVNEVLRQIVAEELERLADADERLRLVTVTSIDTSPGGASPSRDRGLRRTRRALISVISCSTQNRKKFEKYLQERRALGKLVYGLHVTDHALLTCLVYDRFNRHFHFVDGSDGGYALAANALKEQIKSAASSR